jgi:hypothetical protein
MKGDIFEDWVMKVNNWFKSQNKKVIMILDNVASHGVSCGQFGQSHDFST